jgi:hypothetical protein
MDGEAAKTFYSDGSLRPNEHDFVVLFHTQQRDKSLFPEGRNPVIYDFQLSYERILIGGLIWHFRFW